MADNDMYNSKGKYERFLARLSDFSSPPSSNPTNPSHRRKYYCKNKVNLEYFSQLEKNFAAKDLSYPRRLRLFAALKIITFVCSKDLTICSRDDIDEIVGFMHTVNKSIKTKQDFILDIKHIWKQLFPEKDEKERIDETAMPYPVRHLSNRMDVSKQKRRKDKLTIEEFEKLVKAFANDVRIQAFLTLNFESLGRPQEVLFSRIRDLELHNNYGKLWISEHSKEGTGFMEIIDSYPYISEWLNQHPLRNDPNAFLFINLGNTGRYKQLKSVTINKHIKNKLKLIGIDKPVTCYSLKRSGVTYRRLVRGESDTEIQHAARWTSTRQIKTYDLSEHDESFKLALVKRGLLKDDKISKFKQLSKTCLFCETINGLGHDFCKTCKRPLDREKLYNQEKIKDEELKILKNKTEQMEKRLKEIDLIMNKAAKNKPEILDMIVDEM